MRTISWFEVCKLLLLASLVSVSATAAGQGCPSGIPSANNPSCLPPSDAASPYYVAPAPPPPQPSGYWISQWGAIATDAETGNVGTASRRASKQEALGEAMMQCKSGGGLNCKLLIVFDNQCGALAWPTAGGKAAGAGGKTPDMAEKSAMQACDEVGKACQIVYSQCSLPVYRTY